MLRGSVGGLWVFRVEPVGVQQLAHFDLRRTAPLGPLGFEGAQHRQTLRPCVDGIRSKAPRPD